MVSLDEEEKFIQMVIDFIESEPNSPLSLLPPDYSNFQQKPKFPTLQDVLGMVTDDEKKIFEKIKLYTKGTYEVDGKKDDLKNRILQGLKTDGFEVSLCRFSCFATSDRLSGNYEYIDVIMKNNDKGDDDDEGTRLIVDLNFKSQFEIVRPTQTYSELLNYVPCIFVGSEEKIMKVISLICSAAKLSLRERGLHIPPWRQASYMQSKWLSKNCYKISPTLMEF